MNEMRRGASAPLAGLALAAALVVLAFARPAAADMIGNCELTGQKGAFPLSPARAGQITVEVNLPAPGWWNGDTPETIKDGYEYCMAANIAHRAGLDKVRVVNVAWDALVAGQIDAAMTDTAIVLGQAAVSNGMMEVVGQYSTGETYGALYPKGSANEATFDKIIQSLIDDGTLKALSKKYLAGAWGADPLAVPYFQPGT